MYCSRCGAELAAGVAFCSKCGTSTTTVPSAAAVGLGTPSIQRPAIITLLAVLQFIAAGVWAICAVAVMGGAFAIASDQVPVALVGFLLAGLAALQFMCGFGLWKLKPYGRTLQLVFAWIGLIGFPVGTIIAILILVYLFKPGIKILFSGRPASELTQEESALVAALGQGSSLSTVIVVVAVVIGLFLVTAVVAAIAVPSLLRARVGGNEASTIASLRAINSAQVAFASSCGNGYFASTLEGLATTGAGMQEGFLPRDLASDPAIKSGYAIRLTAPVAEAAPRACNGVPVAEAYFVSAEPVTPGSTGIRYFATNNGMTLYQAPSAIEVSLTGPPPNAAPIQ